MVCDLCKWQCLETRDGFDPVDNSSDIQESTGDYYPVAYSRNLGVHVREPRIATSNSKIVNSNQALIGYQRSTVIILK
jgi:hypothetical protein